MSANELPCVDRFLDVLPPTCDVLWEHQRRQLDQLAAALRSAERRILVQLPTGGGKTHEIASIALAAARAGLPALILATRTRLVRQLHERLQGFGVAHGVIAAEMPGMLDHFQMAQIASVDTLYRRCIVDKRMALPAADIVVFDEAHLAVASSRLAILEQYPDAVRIGFSATPARKSGRSLSAAFDRLILGPPILELIRAGLLVRPRIFSKPIVTGQELTALPQGADNDYAPAALGKLMSRPKLVGDVVSNWLRIAAGRRTLVFACNKSHGAHLTEEFCREGVSAELLTDEDDEAKRETVIGHLEAGQTHVIVNCFLLAYGVDIPAVECVVLARPTRSLVMYLQMVGRGLRPFPAKDYCFLIDHGRCVENLGLPTGDFAWSLDDRRNVNREALEARNRALTVDQPRTCPECGHVWLVSELGNACEMCGWVPTPTAKPIDVEEADLSELDEQAASPSPHAPEVEQFFCEAMRWYASRWSDRWREQENRGRWWAWVKTRERFKLANSLRLPGRLWEAVPTATTAKVSGWLKSRHIRDMKSRRWAA